MSADNPEVQELRKALDSLRVISELGRQVTRSLKIKDLAEVLYESLSLLFPIDTFGLAFYAARSRQLVAPYNRVDGEVLKQLMRMPIEGTLTGWALTNRQTLVIRDIRTDLGRYLEPKRQELYLRETPFLSALYLPLFEEDELLGVVTVQSREVATYTELHARFLESLAGFVTVALRNSLNHLKIRRLNRQMRHLSRTDQLTGLANRRSLAEFLERTIPYAKRNSHGFALLFLDLDGFKPINDSHGHAAGDAVLVQLARRLTDTLRDSDLVARVGGDEFIAVALEVDTKKKAELLADKVLAAVALPLEWKGHPLTLGTSVGLALYPDHGLDADSLITQADNAMYRAKLAGKRRFKWATKPRV